MAKKSRSFTLGALIAAGAGYAAGLLTAPKSGKETRKDIAKNASKAKTEGEKQLKRLHSELNELVKQGEKQLKDTKSKANTQLSKKLSSAKKSREKAKQLLSALHEGDAEDPELKSVLSETKKIKTDLKKFLKK